MLIGAGAATALACLAWAGMAALPKQPLALVYRGPASCNGCSEAVAALLRSTPTGFRAEFCGPDEKVKLSAESLATATVYAQPGGGNVTSAWRRLHGHAGEIRDFVHDGGSYLGFCLGAYLRRAGPGFALLPGDVGRYISSRQASTRRTDDTVLPVHWRVNRGTCTSRMDRCSPCGRALSRLCLPRMTRTLPPPSSPPTAPGGWAWSAHTRRPTNPGMPPGVDQSGWHPFRPRARPDRKHRARLKQFPLSGKKIA